MTARHVGAEATMRAVALAGMQSGKSMRGIAVEFYGADRVAAGWHADSRMRAKVRRLADRAQAASGGGPDNAGHDAP